VIFEALLCRRLSALSSNGDRINQELRWYTKHKIVGYQVRLVRGAGNTGVTYIWASSQCHCWDQFCALMCSVSCALGGGDEVRHSCIESTDLKLHECVLKHIHRYFTLDIGGGHAWYNHARCSEQVLYGSVQCSAN
jgi:hypothetical protein